MSQASSYLTFFRLTYVTMSVWYRQPDFAPATKPTLTPNVELIPID